MKKGTKREIFFCDVHVKYKDKIIVLKNIVTKDIEGDFWHRDLKKHKIEHPVPIVKVNIIASLGFENSN